MFLNVFGNFVYLLENFEMVAKLELLIHFKNGNGWEMRGTTITVWSPDIYDL